MLLRENIVELIGRRGRFGSTRRIELHWRAFGHGWSITMIRERHSVAAEVGGQHPDAEAFFRAFRFEWGFFQSRDAIAVPLLDPLNPLMGHAEAEGATLDALCWLLRSRPDARARLGDTKRMRWLARDMAAQPLASKVIPDEAPSTTVAILDQLQRLGFTHPVLGRPMPDDELISPREVSRRILDALEGRRSTLASAIDPAQVEREVMEHYYDVQRWPFEAILV
jgi:hypothetical protein